MHNETEALLQTKEKGWQAMIVDSVLDNLLPIKTISIPIELWKSEEGKYFIGQSEQLQFGPGTAAAWAGLVNPVHSGTVLYLFVHTMSNYNDQAIVTQIWLDGTEPASSLISSKVSPTNLAFSPPPTSKVLLKYASNITVPPSGGVNIFNRVVPAQSTVEADQGGKIIIPPGSSFGIWVFPPPGVQTLSTAALAFGWSEKKASHC